MQIFRKSGSSGTRQNVSKLKLESRKAPCCEGTCMPYKGVWSNNNYCYYHAYYFINIIMGSIYWSLTDKETENQKINSLA